MSLQWCAVDVCADGAMIGKVSSVVADADGRAFALAYLRCRSKGNQIALEGKRVQVNGVDGQVVEVPFLQRDFRPGQAPSIGAADKAARQAEDRFDIFPPSRIMMTMYVPH